METKNTELNFEVTVPNPLLTAENGFLLVCFKLATFPLALGGKTAQDDGIGHFSLAGFPPVA